MLQTLYIENIAVIEKTSIDFDEGLCVLTGETGAGKSIIIDAINAVLGRRTSKEIIRTGEDSAFVSAQFDNIGQGARLKLEELGFESDEDSLIIQRTLSQSGKSVCKINGRPANNSMLKELGSCLINIHGQHESYELFSPETHIDYIDSYGSLEAALEEYRQEYREYKRLDKKLKEANSDEGERLREIDLLKYQCDELNMADVAVGEEEALENERTSLMSFEKLFDLLTSAKMLLEGDESNSGGADALDEAANALQKASEYNAEYQPIADTLSDLYYNLRDCCDSVSDMLDSLESDPQRLEEIEERLDLLNRLSRKYNVPCDELSALCESMQERLDELLSLDQNRDELIEEFNLARQKTQSAAEKLSELRIAAAEKFCNEVKNEMSFLNMPNVEIIARFEKAELYDKGIDKMELLISANPGEAPRPVAKIASGGELSRMMLAIKTVLSNVHSADTLIFDEVDTGISGSAAEKVGLKLKEVSNGSQVLCVTHQAQIAALADSHYLISKQIDNGRTYTEVKRLDRDGRKHELARIIGGVSITEAALSHAEDMLKNNNI